MIRFFLLFWLVPCTVYAQIPYRYNTSVPVKINGEVLPNAWVGGLNAAQFNTLDLNNDARADLVLYDRTARKVITFLNENNQYQFNPDYEALFPNSLELGSWMLLRDFNCDGKKDLFTGDNGEIKVFRNTPGEGGVIEWEPVSFFIGENFQKQTVIQTFRTSTNSYASIQIQVDDIPSIGDVDGDGDVDIFNMRFPEGRTVEFQKNMSIENYGTCDSLSFVRQTSSWGNFRACACDHFAFDNGDCSSSSRTKHAGGKFLLAGDFNGDQRVDILYSQAECSLASLLPNEGTVDMPSISSYSIPLILETFPGLYYEDIDFDGVNDIIASPTMEHRENNDIDLRKSSLIFKNHGSNNQPQFQFEKDNFLQQHMIDLGDNAVPAFVDADGDADMDLFVSVNPNAGSPSRIFHFKNEGTISLPSFNLIDEDYLNLSSQYLSNLKIQFADLDRTKTKDLVFTATTNNSTGMYYLPNTSSSSLVFDNQQLIRVDLPVLSTENLHLTDISGDNHPDILLGRNTGALEYWQNVGDGASSSFQLKDESYLGITSSISNQNLVTHAVDIDADNKADLLLVDETGIIQIITDFKNSGIAAAEQLVAYNSVSHSSSLTNIGGQIWIASADIFNSGSPAIVAGTTLGGLRILESTNQINLFPNFAQAGSAISLRLDDDYDLMIYSNTGKRIGGPYFISKYSLVSASIPDLAAGFYIFRFVGNNKSFSKKIVIK